MEWKFIGLKNTYYRGDNQMTFYQEFGPTLHCGDPFYQAKEYDRLDASIYFLRKKNIDCYGKLSFHFVGGRVQSSQELTIRVNFGQRINIK